MQTNPGAKKQIQQMLQDTGYERCHYRRKKIAPKHSTRCIVAMNRTNKKLVVLCSSTTKK